MSKPDLYICHTAYQVMIDLLRTLRSGEKSALIISSTVPDAKNLAARLEALGCFFEIRVFDESQCSMPNIENPALMALLQHKLEKHEVERSGFSIYPPRYRTIYIHNDWSLLGRYLQDLGAHYTLCEDTFASTCWQRHPLLENQRAVPGFARRQSRGIGYLYWGDYRGVDAVETEDPSRCPIFKGKLVHDSKAALLHSLTEEEKTALCGVFITQALPQAVEGASILMTHSFVQDGTMSQTKQNALWIAVADHYHLENGPFFIKPHPRDIFDYSQLFPDAIILERTMPSEVLNFALPFRFARAVTVQSTALAGFEAADEKISLTLPEAEALLG